MLTSETDERTVTKMKTLFSSFCFCIYFSFNIIINLQLLYSISRQALLITEPYFPLVLNHRDAYTFIKHKKRKVFRKPAWFEQPSLPMYPDEHVQITFRTAAMAAECSKFDATNC